MKYDQFNFQDFILDEDFQNWVLEPDTELNLFWINWIQNHPEKQEDISRAKIAILELYLLGERKEDVAAKEFQVIERVPTTQEIQSVWNNIISTIHAPEYTSESMYDRPTRKILPMFSIKKWSKIAASILVLISISYLFWLKSSPETKVAVLAYKTTFGETRLIILPDSSKVFLNGNSRLAFAKSWAKNTDREVELSGEGFFSVVHTKNHNPFRVKLMPGAQVEVLGTEFTVTNRISLSRVVLNKGKVKVSLAGSRANQATRYKATEEILSPGELVEIDRIQGKLPKKYLDHPESYSAFTENKIEFSDAPLSEVARVLQDTYGYQVNFLPASIANKRFTSSGSGNQLNVLFFAIEKSFNLKVTRKGNQITIQSK